MKVLVPLEGPLSDLVPSSGKMVFNPDSASLIEAKDTLIVLGQPSSISKLEKLVS